MHTWRHPSLLKALTSPQKIRLVFRPLNSIVSSMLQSMTMHSKHSGEEKCRKKKKTKKNKTGKEKKLGRALLVYRGLHQLSLQLEKRSVPFL